MRIMKNGGCTPCDRRLDRSAVAIVAAATMLLTVASARANPVHFSVNEAFSSLTMTSTELLNAFSPTLPNDVSGPADFGHVVTPIGNVTHFTGGLLVDVTPSSLQFVPGYSMTAVDNGNWFPGENNVGKPVGTAAAQAGNYGIRYPFSGAFESHRGFSIDAKAGGGVFPNNPVMPLIGTSFNLGASTLTTVAGVSETINGVLEGSISGALAAFRREPLVATSSSPQQPFPTIQQPLPLQGFIPPNAVSSLGPLFKASGIPAWSSSGTWDGTTLTLNIHSRNLITSPNSIFMHGVPTILAYDGVIVLNTYYWIPEPSTVTLLGFGIAGLMSHAWRARQRKNLIA